MANIKSFLKKYAEHDLPTLSEALQILSVGIGLQPVERKKVNDSITAISEASTRIVESLKDLSETKVNPADVKKAVAEYVKTELATTVADMVERGIEAALEAREKAAKTPPQE